MTYAIQDKHWQTSSFTVRFSFSNGVAHLTDLMAENVVNNALGLKYRILVKHPVEGGFWMMKGMENPMTEDEIDNALNKFHNGYLSGSEFVFEVYQSDGKTNLFATKFNVEDKIPDEAFKSDRLVITPFTWSFPLPQDLQVSAKQALENHVLKISVHN